MKTFSLNTHYKKILADTITPVSIYLKIRDKFPNSILLESSDYHANDNSFSYICFNPIASIKVENEVISQTFPDGSADVKNIDDSVNVSNEIHQFTKRFKADSKADFKFINNGIFGYIAYDAVRYFEDVDISKKEDALSIPDVYYAVYQNIIAINHFKNEAYIFAHCYNNESNIDEIRILENIKELTNAQQYALNVWLISFYFAGIRVSDVLKLKWRDFLDDRLHYRMGKNSKLVSLKVPDKVLNILNKLDRDINSVYIFKELEGIDEKDDKLLRTRIKTATRNFNRRLEIVAEKAGIDKKLSMHIARHSFGNISGDKIPIQMLQKLYRHSSVTTTIMYQSNFIQKDTDEALDKVINF